MQRKLNKKQIVPKVVAGGQAIPLGNNYFYMSGRKHEQGGIDIGENPKTGLEVEDGEVIKTSAHDLKVFSSVPFLAGHSPAELILKGNDSNKVFKAQEDFKKQNKLNNDGTKKAKYGLNIRKKYITGGDNQFSNISYFNNTELEKILSLNKTPSILKEIEIPNKPYTEYELQYANNAQKKINDVTIDYRNYLYNNLKAQKENNVNTPYYILDNTIYDFSGRNNLIDRVNENAIPLTLENIKEFLPKFDYITGSKEDLGRKVFNSNKKLRDRIEQLSSLYGINPNVFFERLSHEGFVDNIIKEYNEYTTSDNQKTFFEKDFLNTDKYSPFHHFGLDDTGDLILKNKIKLLETPPEWYTAEAINEKNRKVITIADGLNVNDILNFKAAHIKYIQDEIKRKYPNLSDEETQAYINAAYNRGLWSDKLKNKEFIMKQYAVPKYKNGGKITNKNKAALGDWLDIGASVVDILGNIGSYASNMAYLKQQKKYINQLKGPEQPVPLRGVKLKTNINIAPQLDAIRESVARYEKDVDNNTSSSQVGLARKQKNRIDATLQKNQLYSQKENLETELINKNKLNAQQVSSFNTQRYNQYLREKNNVENQKLLALANLSDKKSEALSGMLEGFSDSISGIARGINQRGVERLNLKYLASKDANGDKILKDLKSPGDEWIENYKAKQKTKKANRQANRQDKKRQKLYNETIARIEKEIFGEFGL